MKKFVLATVLSFSFVLSNAQDSLRHFEFGATFLTANNYNRPFFFQNNNVPIDFMKGLFFRYTKNRFGFRSQINYSKHYSSGYNQNGIGDVITVSNVNKNFDIGIGGQYSLLKKKNWLYTFVDLSYRNQFSKGFNYLSGAGINAYTNSSTGLNTSVGLGFKIKTLNNLYLSPELGYNIFYGNLKHSNTIVSTGETFNYNGIDKNFSPFLKLHFTYKFK
ncbi:MAG: hypothetical protein H0U95_03415 [Bacteroidetes bacterium]|nr:hypothetical protein [Bacteroidota bacterium]